MQALPIKITTAEMRTMFYSIIAYTNSDPDAVIEFTDIDDYSRRAIRSLAEVSQGEVHLVDETGKLLDVAVPLHKQQPKTKKK